MAFRRLTRSLAATSFIHFTSAAVGDTCFYPDGITTEPDHTPCNTTLSASACCDPLDSCSTSGLCLGRTGFPYRGSCTDRTWKSGNCPTTCLGDPFNNQVYSDFTPIWPCDKPGAPSPSVCCNSPNRNCCTIATFDLGSTGSAFKQGMDLMIAEIANFSSSSTVPAVTITVTATATAPASAAETGNSTSGTALKPASSSSSPSNLGPAIGLGIGLPLGLLAVGVLGFLFWRERKHSQAENESRMKVLEMDPGRYAQGTYKQPDYSTQGPPPAPPKPQQVDEETWNSQTSTSPSRFNSVQKSPGLAAGLRTEVHELI